MQLSEHFTLAEFTHSQTADRMGYNNQPPAEIIKKLHVLAEGMETIRALLGKPILISSGYRSPFVNTAVGGSKNSQHVQGEACDFTCPGFGTPADIVKAILASGTVHFDQLILEFFNEVTGSGWVHVSFSGRNRLQALVIDSKGTRVYGAIA